MQDKLCVFLERLVGLRQSMDLLFSQSDIQCFSLSWFLIQSIQNVEFGRARVTYSLS
jgi:hypothetical protein